MLERLEKMMKRKESLFLRDKEQMELKKLQVLDLEMQVGCLKSQYLAQSLEESSEF
jgi:hypothetical protein